MVDLAVALGLWTIALWVARMERWFPALFFLTGAGTLGAGLLSTTGSDWGSRLFYLLLAWCSPALFALHYELISRPPARSARVTLWAFLGLASLCSLPPLLWTRAALEQKGWNLYWREGVRLMLFLSVIASVVLVAWYARHNWAEARRRPIRLIAFGNVAAVMPLMLLSLLPSTFSFPAKIPWEVSFLGLLLSPLLYSYALMPAHPLRPGITLKRTSVYYLLFVSFCFLFLFGTAILRRFSLDSQRDWPWVGILLSAGCVLAVVPLSRLLERLMDWVWFGGGPSYARVVGQLAESLAVTLDRPELQRLLVHELARVMHLSWSALFLENQDQKQALIASDGLDVTKEAGRSLLENGELMAYLGTQSKPVTHEQVRKALVAARLSEGERWWLDLADLAFWLPLASEEALQGALLIGPKSDGDFFTLEDERILTTLAYQAGIAAHNVRLGEEKAAIEAELVQAQKMEAIGRLAAGIAHDFNNILTSIIGYAQLLETQEGMPEEAVEDLQTIASEGNRAARLIRQILDFSRKSIVQRQPLDLFSFLKETFKFLQWTIPENIHLSLEVDANEYVVLSDPTMMRQVLANLAVNAYDAMPKGGELRFRLSRFTLQPDNQSPFPDMQPGEWISLSVADTGVGISQAALSHMFEPFFTTKGVGKGTGLGLAQVYGIVKQHEGHISVATQEGKGSTFTIYLPALPVQKVTIEETSEEIRQGYGETILVVEDELVVLEAIKEMLERANYRVLAVSDAYEALNVHEQHREEVALVLTDMVMPDIGGKELIQILQAREPHLKTVVTSGYPLEEGGRDFLAQGSVEWIGKPVSIAQLAQVVDRVLHNNAS